MPTLNHTLIAAEGAEPHRWLLMLHGIYGSGRNWAPIARRLTAEKPEWGVMLADLRLHGESLGFEPPHTLAAAAADVSALAEAIGQHPEVVLGHSFGGKVALAYARDHGDELRQVWVIDSTLRVREPGGSAWRVLEAVRSLPDTFGSRDELVEGMARFGYPAPLANWLGMNLERDGDRLRWKLDWDGVEQMLSDYFQADLWPLVEQPPEAVEVHLVAATDSDALDDGDSERLAEAAGSERTHLHRVAGGHWIHVDNPGAVVDLLVSNLPV